MRLNPDCVRDCLIYLEDNLTYIQPNGNEHKIIHAELPIFDVTQKVTEKYFHDYNEVLYALEMLIDAEYLKMYITSKDQYKNMTNCRIYDITYNGHEFLNTIRPESIWSATKNGAAKLGLSSIRALSSIAMSVMNAVITDPTVIEKITSYIK